MIDLLTGDNGDLKIASGDLVIGWSNEQHKEYLLLMEPATLLEDASVGIDAINFINSDDLDGLVNKVNEQFTKDGIVLHKIFFDNETGDLVTDGDYPN